MNRFTPDLPHPDDEAERDSLEEAWRFQEDSEPDMSNVHAEKIGDMIKDDLGIGKRAKDIRTAHRLTLQEVADRAGLAKSYVWEIERGQNTNPSIHTLVSLAKALGCSLDALVGRDTFMKPQLRPEAMQIAVQVDKLLRSALSAKEVS